jgi:hypothetical protein
MVEHGEPVAVWESAAKESTSSRLKPSRVAIRSALIPCGTKLIA